MVKLLQEMVDIGIEYVVTTDVEVNAEETAKELTYYSVWYEVSAEGAKVMGNNVAVEIEKFGDNLVVIVSRKSVKYQIENWGMNKSDKFIERFAARIEKEIEKMITK